MNQITYLPYFPSIDADIKVNRVHFFNNTAFRSKYILNAKIQDKARKLCAMYVDESLRPSKNITVAVIDDEYELPQLSDQQLTDLRSYMLALMFCTLTQNSKQHGACASDHFTLYTQNFGLLTDTIGYSSGSYIRGGDSYCKINKKRFVRPEFITDSEAFQYDEKLFAAFANLIDRHDSQFDRIFAALEWVKCAFSNVDDFRPEIRPVMLVNAFEILFQGETGHFADGLETLLEVNSFGIDEYEKKLERGKKKVHTLYGWWARDFYDLRSKAVHQRGLEPANQKNQSGTSHVSLALKVMNFCFYKILEHSKDLTYEPSIIEGFGDKQWTEKTLRNEIEGLLKEYECK